MQKERSKRLMRVKIANDVLKRLRYLDVRTGHGYVELGWTGLDDEKSAQKYLPEIEKKCNVCALGAMFLSHIRFKNEVSVGDLDYVDDTDIINKMKDYFDVDQLKLIEKAFENWSDNSTWVYKAPAFYTIDGIEPKDDKDRLRLIMKNIVRNKGTFKPEY